MPNVRCPYFSMSASSIPMQGLIHAMRVPVCRCQLTELLVSRPVQQPEGEVLAQFVQAPELDGQPHPVIGCDMRLISPVTCTRTRSEEGCVPGFAALLTAHGMDTSLPPDACDAPCNREKAATDICSPEHPRSDESSAL